MYSVIVLSLLGLHTKRKKKAEVLAEVRLMSFPLREAETLARETFKHLTNTRRDSEKTMKKMTPNIKPVR